MLVYGLSELVADPLSLFTVWKGGMSFHGGLSGVLIAMCALRPHAPASGSSPSRTRSRRGRRAASSSGRIGNFINGELWGKVTSPDAPWAVIVNGEPRHASQLYEAFLEGLVLFTVLWLYTRKPRPMMAASGLFLMLYGVFRFLIEFVRVPDEQLGYIALGWITMGHVLSAPMVIAGAILLVLALRRAWTRRGAADTRWPPRAMANKAG